MFYTFRINIHMYTTAYFAMIMLIMLPLGAGNDFQKDKQFRKLNAQKDMVEVTVVRGGSNKLVQNTDVVVGDVLVLATGDKVTAGTALLTLSCSIIAA